MFQFIVEAIPHPQSSNAQQFGGAWVTCWIDFAGKEGAELLTKFYLEQEGWQIQGIDQVNWVVRDDVINEPQTLQYISEAEESGASFVYHTWPLTSEDADTSL